MDSRGGGDGLRCDSDLVRNYMQIAWKCYPALQSGLFGVTFIETCMILVDRVATKSMDSRGEWDGLRCDSDLVRNYMEIGWNCYPALESGIFGVISI